MRPEGPLRERDRQGGLQDPGLAGDCGAAAHTGPGRKGTRSVAAAIQGGSRRAVPVRSRLEPSIVNEPGGEAPRVEPGEPHSPGTG
jgi:hypothetical protein